jgi:hypothetical protein
MVTDMLGRTSDDRQRAKEKEQLRRNCKQRWIRELGMRTRPRGQREN